MTLKAIDSMVYGANVRSSAGFGDNVVTHLNQCDPVEVVGPKQGDRWMPCKIKGHNGTVFISKNVLRNRVSDAAEKLVRRCVKEWLRFDKEKGQEHIDPYHKIVGEYWQNIGLNLDGTDRDTPWSAAYISYCVRKAGGYDDFKFAAAHSKYTNQAIRRRLDGVEGCYWGFRISEKKPKIGDMVCRKRTSLNLTYDFAAQHKAYKSHCDIVISVRDDHVSTLGGNVGHTVKRTNYPLDANGFLKDTGQVYAVLKNRL